ncbi:MAG: hypothetical protein Tp1124DCM108671_49 [Prokaryotic dsDNA virus sp.]|nr:MAG: hypothetical protein Tp1125DCM102451_20 [Prokaryotic dsDNA virus sp.]QDP65606.1 MAG: hypothetical protein Tp1124DCM108671_49 [Prokaryotic dsDNA virus sp.]
MNKIYKIIAGLRKKFYEMSFGICKDKNEIDNAVQELMLYFLQMNKQTLKDIYNKDGKKGLIKYGAVVLRRSLTSVRSPFYYKYNKYYTRINSIYGSNSTIDNKSIHKYKLENIPQEIEKQNYKKLELIDKELDKLEYWYDRELFKLYYYEGNTLDSLAEKTGISRNSVFTTIDKVRKELKKILND